MQVSHAIGGERVAALLPLLLRPGALGKMPKKQRERIRRETGISEILMTRESALSAGRCLLYWLTAATECRTCTGTGRTIL